MSDLLRATDRGLYCAAGDFYIDPWKPVARAIITHAHGDHLRWGCEHYLTAEPGRAVVQARLPAGAVVETLPFGERKFVNGVEVSFAPAGHILGSAQVRLCAGGETWVVSGDYKTEPDRTCTPFEPVRCDVFITECTFGLPIFRWQRTEETFREMNEWWVRNRAEGFNSVILGYALGKAQRILSGLADGPVIVHSSLNPFLEIYRASGVSLPGSLVSEIKTPSLRGACIVAPPSVLGSSWLKQFEPYRTAFASGWMAIRENRRRRGVDAGFVLSDHVDWPSLLEAVHATGASRIGVTHGYVDVVKRYLTEVGYDSFIVPTHFEGGVAEGSE